MIGNEIRAKVFRDTTGYYLDAQVGGEAASSLVAFARRHIGKEVLDYGCATGSYGLALQGEGFSACGADINPEYVAMANERGLTTYLCQPGLPLEDNCVDSVLLFEVLEHAENPAELLAEAARVARTNVLVTVPNCAALEALQAGGVIYEHFSDLDHRQFFTTDTLAETMRPFFSEVVVTPGDAVDALCLLERNLASVIPRAMRKFGLLKSRYFRRLFAQGTL
ncbi:MAG: class I SAM-dependent methyltransferase [Myxococcota bacterium]|nr:class I SAM-dependent methyltransferase [Myxococcota bacterium]